MNISVVTLGISVGAMVRNVLSRRKDKIDIEITKNNAGREVEKSGATENLEIMRKIRGERTQREGVEE